MVKKAAHATPNRQLRAARLERGWTQQQVADRFGAPLSLNVTRWENGTASPAPTTMIAGGMLFSVRLFIGSPAPHHPSLIMLYLTWKASLILNSRYSMSSTRSAWGQMALSVLRATAGAPYTRPDSDRADATLRAAGQVRSPCQMLCCHAHHRFDYCGRHVRIWDHVPH